MVKDSKTGVLTKTKQQQQQQQQNKDSKLEVACVAGGIFRAQGKVLVAKPWTPGRKAARRSSLVIAYFQKEWQTGERMRARSIMESFGAGR